MNNEKNKRSEKEITLIAHLKEEKKVRKTGRKERGREREGKKEKENKISDPHIYIISP